jgi:hypothetical protein
LSNIYFPWQDKIITAPLDCGFTCESFSKETGKVKTGAGFATLAGFLSYALYIKYIKS